MDQLWHADAFLLTHTSVRTLPVTRQCPLDQEAVAMADFARFRAITGLTSSSPTDQPVTIENGGSAQGKKFHVDLPGLDPTRAAILMFKVSGKAGTRLQIENNKPDGTGGRLIDFELDSTFTKPRSWHEIVQGSQLAATSNDLVISISDNPAPHDKVTISDVVLLYHAKTP